MVTLAFRKLPKAVLDLCSKVPGNTNQHSVAYIAINIQTQVLKLAENMSLFPECRLLCPLWL